MGVRLIKVSGDNKVASLAIVPNEEDQDNIEEVDE